MSGDKMGDRMADLADAFSQGTGPAPWESTAPQPDAPEAQIPSPDVVAAQQRAEALEAEGKALRRARGRERVRTRS